MSPELARIIYSGPEDKEITAIGGGWLNLKPPRMVRFASGHGDKIFEISVVYDDTPGSGAKWPGCVFLPHVGHWFKASLFIPAEE